MLCVLCQCCASTLLAYIMCALPTNCILTGGLYSKSCLPLAHRALRTSWVTWTSRWQVGDALLCLPGLLACSPSLRLHGVPGQAHVCVQGCFNSGLPLTPHAPTTAPPTLPPVPPLAGTRTGITAAQLDVKLPGGVPLAIVEEGVRAAARGRAQLLSIMEQALPKVGGGGVGVEPGSVDGHAAAHPDMT